ncbi:UDP-N-acetylmuramoyl-L-alanyl-D-glutamate--2,6-diaminopimelate ligase [Corynebacterium kroppenstedtii]|uniref:UDP-N-acetylmuramoyl-L-alanyl-D-glutamate--2, 6-diaminopimelate ligase n=1 Tax=Corynebacterium sp. PCR 32 TaxID=3351342 RepID=UPI0030B30E52
MATLEELAEIAGGRLIRAHNPGLTISDIGLNAQALPAGGLFAGVPGLHVHGAQFADASPAAAVLTDHDGIEKITRDDLPLIIVDDVRSVLGPVSSAVYGHPSHDLTVIGITGTAGKTTVSYMVESALLRQGISTGLIGTTGTRINGEKIPSTLTTPEAPNLQALFARMKKHGVSHVVMEVSSHAISLGRVAGTHFSVAGFTNLSQDHLDFHPTIEDYFQTKTRLFVQDSPLHADAAVICIDDHWGQRLASILPQPVTVATTGCSEIDNAQQHDTDIGANESGIQPDAWAGRSLVLDSGIQTAEIHGFGVDSVALHIPMPGRFNIANALVAIGLLVKVGMDPMDAIAGLSTVTVPGRLERVDRGQDFMAVVDYAHKPGAIAAVLDTLRGHVRGRIAIVIGAGGDRDDSKRPVMGREAAMRSDLVIVTDDNPRSEDPESIRQQVVAGVRGVLDQGKTGVCEGSTDNRQSPVVREIGDRREAIRAAIQWAQPGDAVIIAGKGHETGQLIGGITYPFDDRVETRRWIDDKLKNSVEKTN